MNKVKFLIKLFLIIGTITAGHAVKAHALADKPDNNNYYPITAEILSNKNTEDGLTTIKFSSDISAVVKAVDIKAPSKSKGIVQIKKGAKILLNYKNILTHSFVLDLEKEQPWILNTATNEIEFLEKKVDGYGCSTYVLVYSERCCGSKKMVKKNVIGIWGCNGGTNNPECCR